MKKRDLLDRLFISNENIKYRVVNFKGATLMKTGMILVLIGMLAAVTDIQAGPVIPLPPGCQQAGFFTPPHKPGKMIK